MSVATTVEKPLKAASQGIRFYRPELDVLRFVAFLMVYLTHTIPVDSSLPSWLKALSNATGLGVPLFFALSAYLITELLMMEKSTSGSIALQSFYMRRCLRIWPLYLSTILVGCLLGLLHRA
jgi:peptidoglycan/LPS O-acetylase OafA/YrhL